MFRLLVRRRVLWAVPVSAAVLLYAYPSRQQVHPVLSSPAAIPLRPVILSPSEHNRSFRALLQSHVVEPILIAKRFIYLLFLFAPVILSSPMLLVGRIDKKGDRWGAVWWYGLLVSRMEAAGPTFIKVCLVSFFCMSAEHHCSCLNGPLLVPISSQHFSVRNSAPCTRKAPLTLLPTQRTSSRLYSSVHSTRYSNPLTRIP